MVIMPERATVVVLAATLYETLWLLAAEAPLVIVIQDELLTAVHVTPGVAVTATVPVPAAAEALAAVGESENVAGACVTETDCPTMLSAAMRLDGVVFNAAVSETVPLPEPEAPLAMVSQAELLVAVQSQLAGVVTLTERLPPPAVALRLAGATVMPHALPAWTIGKASPAIVMAPSRKLGLELAATV